MVSITVQQAILENFSMIEACIIISLSAL